MRKSISLLGSTGSIGRQALEVAALLGVEVLALSANESITLLEEQARRVKPRIVSVYNENAARDFKTRISDTDIRVVSGADGLIEAALAEGAETVVTALVGMAGLRPTLAAIKAGRQIALANKETLVCAGELVMKTAREHSVSIIPIDSELSAVLQCISANTTGGSNTNGSNTNGDANITGDAVRAVPFHEYADGINRIILTASGGPFRGMAKNQLKNVTPEMALRHPNWNMGNKVTIDSATLMNKGFEFAEIFHLFSIPHEKIEVIIHPESIIHSMVEFSDNSVIAQLSPPDMRLPIQYALTYPNRKPSLTNALDFTKLSNLSFFEPDVDAFPCLGLALEAVRTGGTAGAILNGANEAAVESFLNGNIGFYGIYDSVRTALDSIPVIAAPTLDDYIAADAEAREYAHRKPK